MSLKSHPLIAAFAPVPLYFVLIAAAGKVLERLPYYGPVNASTGQPVFSHYPETVLYSGVALLAATLLTSALLLRKANDGWPKVLTGTALVLFIPAQAAFLLLWWLGLFFEI